MHEHWLHATLHSNMCLNARRAREIGSEQPMCLPIEKSEIGVSVLLDNVRCGVGGGGQGMLMLPRERGT
jgi:hypothetical protein